MSRPPDAPDDEPTGLSLETPQETSLRVRLAATRDRLIHQAATNLIRLGKELPGLRNAGYWLYGTATLVIPRGRDVKMLGQVGDRVWRGAQPSLRAFRTLKDMGVTTVVNLRPESDHERSVVGRLGMKYIYLPLPALDAPTHDLTLAFLDAVTDPDNGTVFFHCYHGVDRTGTMAACVRMARDGWTVDEALAEMRAFKVHESGQRSKLVYVAEFADHWAALPEAERRQILHIPDLVAPPPAVPAGLFTRAKLWVADKVKNWRNRNVPIEVQGPPPKV